MSGGIGAAPAGARLDAVRAALAEALPAWNEGEIDDHLARLPPSYALSLETETLARHARLLREADLKTQPFVMSARVDERRSVTEISICTPDQAGLFSRLAGALSAAGADIVDARIFTTTDGLALDSFWVQEARPGASGGGAFADPQRLRALRATISRSLAGDLEPAMILAGRRGLPARTHVFQVPARVLIDDKASATHTVIEVNGRDRPGLLYALTRALAELKLQVSSAKISTYGERVVDVFYVKDAFGLQVTHPKLLQQARAALLAALADPASRAPVEPVVAAQ